MDVEEVGFNPERQAREILRQISYKQGRVDIEAVAAGLDIIQIRREPLSSFEGALLTDAARSCGKILVNSAVNPQRQRFTIAHELGHFLNLDHRPTDGESFMCSKADVSTSPVKQKSALNRHQVQEREANRFAIELLAPCRRIESLSKDLPTVTDILKISDELNLSKQAVAYRYVELHQAPVAVVFNKHGQILRLSKNGLMPKIRPTDCLALPSEHRNLSKGTIRSATQVDPIEWLDVTSSGEAWMETLGQQDGYSLSLLTWEPDGLESEEIGDGGVEDAYERLDRYNSSR